MALVRVAVSEVGERRIELTYDDVTDIIYKFHVVNKDGMRSTKAVTISMWDDQGTKVLEEKHQARRGKGRKLDRSTEGLGVKYITEQVMLPNGRLGTSMLSPQYSVSTG